jgi:hypothetical protein
MYLTGDVGPYTYQELILPDGYRVRFERISSGTGYLDAVYEHTEAPDDYYGAKITWVPATGRLVPSEKGRNAILVQRQCT